MTPRAIRHELKAIGFQLQKACRIDTRYRQYIRFAIMRIDQLDAALQLERTGPGPKKGGVQ